MRGVVGSWVVSLLFWGVVWFPFTRWGVGQLASTFCQVLFLGTALGLSQKTFGFPSPVGVLVSWLQPSARFVFGDRLTSLAEDGLL